MTPQEHELVARLFARQLEYTKMLIEILRSHEIVKNDDDRAFVSFVREGSPRSAAALRAARGEYRKTAKEIGLTVSFPPRRRRPAS